MPPSFFGDARTSGWGVSDQSAGSPRVCQWFRLSASVSIAFISGFQQAWIARRIASEPWKMNRPLRSELRRCWTMATLASLVMMSPMVSPQRMRQVSSWLLRLYFRMWVGGVIINSFWVVFLWQSEQSQHGLTGHPALSIFAAGDCHPLQAQSLSNRLL